MPPIAHQAIASGRNASTSSSSSAAFHASSSRRARRDMRGKPWSRQYQRSSRRTPGSSPEATPPARKSVVSTRTSSPRSRSHSTDERHVISYPPPRSCGGNMLPTVRTRISAAPAQPADRVVGQQEPLLALPVVLELRVAAQELAVRPERPGARVGEERRAVDDPVLAEQQAARGHQRPVQL